MNIEEIKQKDKEDKAIKFYTNYIQAQEKELDWMYRQDEEYYRDEIEQKELLIKGFKTILNLIKKQSKEIEELENQRQNGTLSDGYHTYNDLYYQRCVLFATICNLNKNISWKSKKHNDGKKCFNSDEWFIVGIDTPKGSYTYHYEIKYWDMFEVQELEKGKFWDGHTEKDVTRLLSLIDNYISNDKIKAKIEEINKEMLNEENSLELFYRKKYCKEVLQSLLEKE